jgi:hypothetical protein
MQLSLQGHMDVPAAQLQLLTLGGCKGKGESTDAACLPVSCKQTELGSTIAAPAVAPRSYGPWPPSLRLLGSAAGTGCVCCCCPMPA